MKSINIIANYDVPRNSGGFFLISTENALDITGLPHGKIPQILRQPATSRG
jgi:hypothetical protein